MADNKFDTPELREYPIIPKLKKNVMSHSKPFIAKEPHQEPLGFPGELVDDWHDVAIKKWVICKVNIDHYKCIWTLV